MRNNLKLNITFIFALFSLLFMTLADPRFIYFLFLLVPFYFIAEKVKGRVTIRIIESIPFLYFISSLFLMGDLFYTLSTLIVVILFTKLILKKEKSDYYQIFIVSLLIILLSSVSTISVWFGILLFGIFITGGLMLVLAQSNTSDSIDTKGLLKVVLLFGAIAFVFTFVIFLCIPRVSFGYIYGNPLFKNTKSGFSEEIVISDAPVSVENTVVMRIEIERNLETPIYISGLKYDYFNGREWVKSYKFKRITADAQGIFGKQDGHFKGTVYLEPTGTTVIFGIDRLTGVKGDFISLREDEFGDFFTELPFGRTIKYDTYSDINQSNAGNPPDIKKPEVSDAFYDFSNTLTKGKSDTDIVNTLVNFLRQNNTYSLTPTYSSIEDFVMKNGAGYCEHFASAFVIMSQISGLPARLVSGFITSEWNPTGSYYIILAKNAHTWAEVYLGGRWLRVDPTPSIPHESTSMFSLIIDSIRMGWYRNVVTYNFSNQIEFLAQIRDTIHFTGTWVLDIFDKVKENMTFLLLIPVFIVLVFLSNLSRKKKRPNISELIISLIGPDHKESETIIEFAIRKGKYEELEKILKEYYEYRFASHKNLFPLLIAEISEYRK